MFQKLLEISGTFKKFLLFFIYKYSRNFYRIFCNIPECSIHFLYDLETVRKLQNPENTRNFANH